MHTVREGWLLFVAALLLALIVVVTVSGSPMTSHQPGLFTKNR